IQSPLVAGRGQAEQPSLLLPAERTAQLVLDLFGGAERERRLVDEQADGFLVGGFGPAGLLGDTPDHVPPCVAYGHDRGHGFSSWSAVTVIPRPPAPGCGRVRVRLCGCLRRR